MKTDKNTATYLDFRRKLGWILINNPYLKTEQEKVEERRMMLHNKHQHLSALPHACKFEKGKWHLNNKSKYQQKSAGQVDAATKFAPIAPVILDIGYALTVMEIIW